QSINATSNRVQCTPDLLPSDVTGSPIFNQVTREITYQEGPAFSHVLLVDEINRATPKTQSALLEAMQERRVSVARTTYRLPQPFFLIATQNPIELAGTFPLPEAQLDRFLVKLGLGYPDEATERRVLAAQREAHPLASLPAVMDLAGLEQAQAAAARVYVHEAVLAYMQRVTAETRRHPSAAWGASPRGAIGLR